MYLLPMTVGLKVNKKRVFENISNEKQKQYTQVASKKFGGDSVKESMKLWNSYSDEKKERIKQEGDAIYRRLAANMDKGPESPEVQELLASWHQHLKYFYEPSIDVLDGLGKAYNESPDFNAVFAAIHPDLPGFLQKSIAHYVDILETEWLEREMSILEE